MGGWAVFGGPCSYFLFSKIKYGKTKDFEIRRRGWLNSLGLDFEPFYFILSDTDFGTTMKEKVEASWNDLGPTTREKCEQNARTNNELVLKRMTWTEIEPLIGFSLDRDFAGEIVGYRRVREHWLSVINLRPVYLTEENLNTAWAARSVTEKATLISIAKTAKKVIDDEMTAEDAKKRAEAKAAAGKAEELAANNLKQAAERWVERRAKRLEAAKLSISKSASLMSSASAEKKKGPNFLSWV
ncbi:hypothetical protein BDZ45DRAFT_296550 [Acephala macrosclerotiorum]|nr:hypothetical protein BDZ45DRAFT_296550 [Acephala macrosclerotiorum]